METLFSHSYTIGTVTLLLILLQHLAIQARRHRRGLPDDLVRRIETLFGNLGAPVAGDKEARPLI